MYSYQRGIIKELGPRGKWIERDLSDTPVKDLFVEFEKVYIVLSHPLIEGQIALNRDSIPKHMAPMLITATVNDWLASLGTLSLPTTNEVPDIEVVYAKYRDAWQAGYDINPVGRDLHPDQAIPDADKVDLRLTRSGIDYYKMYKECLITVNGLIHRNNFTSNGLHVIDGAKKKNNNLVGIYHLGELGMVDQVPILPEHVIKGPNEQPLSEVVYLKLDDSVDIANKSVLLSIGGYLHYPDTMVKQAGERLWRIEFKDYPWPQRYLEMKKLIDVSNIERHLDKSTVNDDQIDVSQLYSEMVINELFTLSQSFFIVVNTPELILEKEHLEFTQLPRRFVSHSPAEYPLIFGLGKMYEYWVKKEHKQYLLALHDTLHNHYAFETTEWKKEHSIDSSRTPHQSTSYGRAYFIKIGKQLKTFN